MPFDPPSLEQIRIRTRADLELAIGEPLLDHSLLAKVAEARAGSSYLMHGHIDAIARQTTPLTAEAQWLEQWASSFGVFKKPATFAEGPVVFTGQEGAAVPVGLTVQRPDGARYAVTVGGTILAGTVTATVRALQHGAKGDTAEGTSLQVAGVASGIDQAALAGTGGIVGGLDAETDEELRTRLLSVLRLRPEGGSVADYVRWTLEVPGVTRAWVLSEVNGAGTVGVTCVLDSHPVSIVPNQAKLDEVAAYLEDDRRPVQAKVIVFAPTLVPLNPTIKLEPNTPEVQASVAASLVELLLREAAPGTTLLRTHISEAISNAAGEIDHELVLPAGNVTYGQADLAILGTPTWQALNP